jgi:hypothetical protein
MALGPLPITTGVTILSIDALADLVLDFGTVRLVIVVERGL